MIYGGERGYDGASSRFSFAVVTSPLDNAPASIIRSTGVRFGWGRCASLLALLILGCVSIAGAQELQHQPHPLSTYLDLRPAAAGAAPQSAPSWLESLEFIPAPKVSAVESLPAEVGQTPPSTRSVFRIRLQRPTGSNSEQLQARVFFDDRTTGNRPQVTLWNELGERLLTPVKLGQKLGVPSSETLTLPMHGADYLEIESEGDGTQVRGIFLSWLEAAEVLQPSDFQSREAVRQPFHILSATGKQKDDSYLYGVVTASLHNGKPLVLQPATNPVNTLQFDLERQPLMAVVTFEVLGSAVDAPPSVTVNGKSQGPASLELPDLADPGFQGISHEDVSQLEFRYTGWLHAQKTIPGELLTAGLNNLSLGLSNGTEAVAIRSVAIQLKYNWEKFDSVLAPAPAADEN